ncbi:hypothetical protein AAG570_010616 [Ranatra chinensis]|uniref:Uncharacterized protein n=1 Tax=Ranatra chinensis TaxID=642074 RepID=A0ABD0YQ85_9HEMI
MLRYSKYLKMVSYMGLPESQLESSDYLDLTIRLRRRLAGDLSSTVTFVNTSTAATSSAGPTKVGFTWLLLCFEALSLGGFDDIPEPVQRYYSTVLGNHIKVLSSKNESMRVPISEAHHFKLSDISDFVTLV